MDTEMLKGWFDEVCSAKKFLVDRGGGCYYDEIVANVAPVSRNALLLHLEKDSNLGTVGFLNPETSEVKYFVYFLVEDSEEGEQQ